MTYAGLTTADKGALLDAKADGWDDYIIRGELVNIDHALAQIAEIELTTNSTPLNEKCPICEYTISGCQCLYSGSAHPDRHDKRRVVLDHLYLLSPAQVQHVISLEKHWQISYADEILNAILKKLIANSPYTEGETK
ncbi:MAG: hypothetical protein ABFC56_10445 [Clostridiaceae bacterium]